MTNRKLAGGLWLLTAVVVLIVMAFIVATVRQTIIVGADKTVSAVSDACAVQCGDVAQVKAAADQRANNILLAGLPAWGAIFGFAVYRIFKRN
ncbi:MAG TPA: hypothetical protein VJL27_00730 [Patescibacteria group bacterium]|nr:hypothetical protein [Patescibacteria group bacterium]